MLGPQKTSSSSTTASKTETLFWIFTLFPIFALPTYTFCPSEQFAPMSAVGPTWTQCQILVPGPILAPGSMIAVSCAKNVGAGWEAALTLQLTFQTNCMEAGVAGQALSSFLEIESPAVSWTNPISSVFSPSLCKIAASMWAVPVDGISGASGFHDDSVSSLFDIQQVRAEPVHILRFHNQESLDQRLIHVGPAVQAHAEGQREFLPGQAPIQHPRHLPGRGFERVELAAGNSRDSLDDPVTKVDSNFGGIDVREPEVKRDIHSLAKSQLGKLELEFV